MTSNVQTVLPGISHGDHCCLLFSSSDEQVAVSVPFLAIGLERGERSVYVGDGNALELLRCGLHDAGVAVQREIEKGRLVLDDSRDYLDEGHFNTDKMIAFLQRTYDTTIAEGFTALRAAGDISWEIGDDNDFRDIVYYETLLDVFFLGKRMVGMCQYPKAKCPPEVLSGILSTHKVAAIDSEVCSNFHYVPPDLLLEKNDVVRHEKRVEWMTSQLLRARRAEEEIRRINAGLEERVAARTAELQAAYKDMESFSYSISHDLRAPLRTIDGFSAALVQDQAERLDEKGHHYLNRIRAGAQRMTLLIEDLLRFSQVSRQEIRMNEVDMSALVESVAEETGASELIGKLDLPPALGDSSLLRQVLVNLISNAVKFTRHKTPPKVEVGARRDAGDIVYYVKDNGAGFDMAHAEKLFAAFQRLHRQDEFEGTGIGLTIVQRIIQRHGGRVWAEASVGEGATFFFTLRPATKPAKKSDHERPN